MIQRRQVLAAGISLGVLGAISIVHAAPQAGGRFIDIEPFPSQFVSPRKVRIWLPPDYNEQERYDSLYMHDGQNLFEPAASFAHGAWDVDKHLVALREANAIRPTIVIAIWNGQSYRSREYGPQEPIETLAPELQARIPRPSADGGTSPQSNAYLKFIAEELVPYVDQHFPTITQRDHRFLMGSSMGGLISLYALSKYPALFGGAGCLSIHWIIATNPQLTTPPDRATLAVIAQSYRTWLQQHLPTAGHHKIYFDHGDQGLDALYGEHQQQIDQLMRAKNYQQNKDWVTRYFAGTDHNEKAWRARLAEPLRFLLK
jgi:enterochelin esterase-like enzyme